jgi:small basic protein
MNCTQNPIPLLLFNCCLADHTENTIPLLLFASRCLAMANVVAYLAIAAQQMVYMPQYFFNFAIAISTSKGLGSGISMPNDTTMATNTMIYEYYCYVTI